LRQFSLNINIISFLINRDNGFDCHDLARDYLAIGYTDTYFGLIKYSNMLDFCHDLIRNYMIIRYAGKDLKATRILDIRIRVSGYNYDYVVKVMAKVLI